MENIKKTELVLLSRPFHLDDIYFKPQGIKDGTAQALVHATPRAYQDRFNEIFAGEWETNTEIIKLLDECTYTKWDKYKKENVEVNMPQRIITCTTITVRGISRSSLGEDNITNDNVATTSEAQSEKRAFAKFGCGSYLYDYKNIRWAYNYGAFQSIEKLKNSFLTDERYRFWVFIKEKTNEDLVTVAQLLLDNNMEYLTVGKLFLNKIEDASSHQVQVQYDE